MFHDLILWSAFIGMYAAYIFRPSLAKKIVMVGLAVIFIFVIQAAKDEYRERLKRRAKRAGDGAISRVSSIPV